jgi:hypothetical protein
VAEAGSLLAQDMGEIDAATLEQAAVLDQARNPTAALRAVPGVAQEGLALGGFEFADDAILQSGEKTPDRYDVHQGSLGSGSFMVITFSLWRLRKASSFRTSARP